MARSNLNYFEEIERVIGDAIGDRPLATKATYALAEKGFMRALHAATRAANDLDEAIFEVESKSVPHESLESDA